MVQVRPFLMPALGVTSGPQAAPTPVPTKPALAPTESTVESEVLRAQLRKDHQLTLAASRARLWAEGQTAKRQGWACSYRGQATYCWHLCAGRVGELEPAPNIHQRRRWQFLDADYAQVMRAPIPGADLPTAGSLSTSLGCWWHPIRRAPEQRLVLPVPGQGDLSDAAVWPWCEALILGNPELDIVWVGRPAPAWDAYNPFEALRWFFSATTTEDDLLAIRTMIANDLCVHQDGLSRR